MHGVGEILHGVPGGEGSGFLIFSPVCRRGIGTVLVGRMRCPQDEATGKSGPPVVWNFGEGRGWPSSCGSI